MSLTKSYVNKDHKWNWNLAFMLYCGGMPISAILGDENFKGCTYNTIIDRATRDNWRGRRNEFVEKEYTKGAKELKDRIEEAKTTHQNFMLDQIEEEREAILQDFKMPGSKMRKERLDALRILDDLARRSLGLDDEKLITHEERIFGMLINLQKEPPKAIDGKDKTVNRADGALVTRPKELEDKLNGHKEEPASVVDYNENESKRTSLAVSPLLDNKNATTGIVTQLNAIPEDLKTTEMQSDEEKEPIQGEWKPNIPNPVAILHRRKDGTEEYELHGKSGEIVAGEEKELEELEKIAEQDLRNQAQDELENQAKQDLNLAEQILERPRVLKVLRPLVV